MSQNPVGITTCALCNKKFTQALGNVLVASNAELRQHSKFIERQLQMLSDHLRTEHPKHWEAIDMYATQYKGFLVFSNYRSTDPQIQRARDQMRWYIHRQTSNAQIPDSKLVPKTRELTAAIALKLYAACTSNSTADEIAAILFDELCPYFKGFRDELQEPGRYPPLLGEKTEIALVEEVSLG